MKPWETRSTAVDYKNEFFKIMKKEFVTGEGAEGEWFYHENNNAITAIGQLDEDQFVLIREYRYVHDRQGIGVIAGAIDPGEDHRDTAAREFVEEAGYKAETVIHLGQVASVPAFSKEVWECYLLRDLTKVEAVKEVYEEIETVILSAKEIDQAILSGEMWDSNAIAAWHMVKLFLEKEAGEL